MKECVMTKLLLLLLCSALFVSCHVDESETFTREYNDFYIYDVQKQSLTQITDDRTLGNYNAQFTPDGKSMISVVSTSTGQFLYMHQGLTTLKYTIGVGNIFHNIGSDFNSQRKIVIDSTREKIYYCANYYDRNDTYLYRYSRDIYEVSLNGLGFRNLTNNTMSLIGSVTLSDDNNKLVYDELDTAKNIGRIVLFDLRTSTKTTVRSSDTTIFLVPQFVHNSDKIVFLEMKKVDTDATIVIISQSDSNYIKHLGTVRYYLMNYFPKLSKNNYYPARTVSFYYEIINLDTEQKISTNTLSHDNECLISEDGSNAFISDTYPGIKKFDIKTQSVTTLPLKYDGLRSIHLLDLTPDGNKILFLGTRQIVANTGTVN
jgi:hypothetical protein